MSSRDPIPSRYTNGSSPSATDPASVDVERELRARESRNSLRDSGFRRTLDGRRELSAAQRELERRRLEALRAALRELTNGRAHTAEAGRASLRSAGPSAQPQLASTATTSTEGEAKQDIASQASSSTPSEEPSAEEAKGELAGAAGEQAAQVPSILLRPGSPSSSSASGQASGAGGSEAPTSQTQGSEPASLPTSQDAPSSEGQQSTEGDSVPLVHDFGGVAGRIGLALDPSLIRATGEPTTATLGRWCRQRGGSRRTVVSGPGRCGSSAGLFRATPARAGARSREVRPGRGQHRARR